PVDVELAGTQAGRGGRGPDPAAAPGPAGDRDAAADDRTGAGGRRPNHPMTAGTRVAGIHRERLAALVGSRPQGDHAGAGRALVEGTGRVARPLEGPDRLAGAGTGVGVVAARRGVDGGLGSGSGR